MQHAGFVICRKLGASDFDAYEIEPGTPITEVLDAMTRMGFQPESIQAFSPVAKSLGKMAPAPVPPSRSQPGRSTSFESGLCFADRVELHLENGRIVKPDARAQTYEVIRRDSLTGDTVDGGGAEQVTVPAKMDGIPARATPQQSHPSHSQPRHTSGRWRRSLFSNRTPSKPKLAGAQFFTG